MPLDREASKIKRFSAFEGFLVDSGSNLDSVEDTGLLESEAFVLRPPDFRDSALFINSVALDRSPFFTSGSVDSWIALMYFSTTFSKTLLFSVLS
jgi:hypothetical protein